MHANAQLSRAREMQPERTEDCTICKKTGCLTQDGWYSDATLDRDEDGYYLAGHGEYLGDAVETPAGWVCSKRCRSQAMYNACGDYDKAALRKVHDACRVLSEYGNEARALVNAHTDIFVDVALISEANDLLDAIGDDGKDMPAWCNRETREDALERVVREARRRIGYLSEDIGMDTANEITFDVQAPYFISRRARQAASAAIIAETLKAAEEGNHA
jgi:hypothetical protein